MPTIPLLAGFVLSTLLLFLLSFMPTPGASGLGEILFVVLFDQAVSNHVLGLGVIMWRFFFNYSGAMIGAVVSAKSFTGIRVKKRRLPTHE